MLETRSEFALAVIGSGGTGVMLLGDLLLETAASSGLYGLLARTYGPEVRGGESGCFLRLGARPFEVLPDTLDLAVVLDWTHSEHFQQELQFKPDGWLIYEETAGDLPPWLPLNVVRCPVSWKHLAHKIGREVRPNLVAFGALCGLLDLGNEPARAVITARFGDRVGEQALQAFEHGAAWAQQVNTWGQKLPTIATDVRRWILSGNEAIVLGALQAGCGFFSGYPITPATDIMEALNRHLTERGGVLVQAEDELAAINMAIGASFAGRRAMTATSGPGFSLMAEGLGLALMAEVPVVVVDVQRVGPSTGIATKTEQADLWAAIASSHGDNPRVVMAPSSVRGCAEIMVRAFNIAEAYRVPVVVLSDQLLGGRVEILDPIPLEMMDRRKQITNEHMEEERRARASDPGRAVDSMVFPGMPGGEYTAESLEHDPSGRPDSSFYMHQIQARRRQEKLQTLAAEDGWFECCGDPDASVALIAWGSTGSVVREAVHAARGQGTKVKGIILHLLFPPQPEHLERMLQGTEALYVAELSSMAQFLYYLRAFYRLPPRVVSIARPGGMPYRVRELLDALNAEDVSARKGTTSMEES
jgi:2-oxoglutarate/2-oxoacid ferredoxin oxidoreductase subunit alpha